MLNLISDARAAARRLVQLRIEMANLRDQIALAETNLQLLLFQIETVHQQNLLDGNA
jgi:hypothetical protein